MRFITLHSFSLRLPSGSPFASPLRLPLSPALLTFAFDNIFISLLFSRPRCFHCNLINIAANSIHFRSSSHSLSLSLSLSPSLSITRLHTCFHEFFFSTYVAYVVFRCSTTAIPSRLFSTDFPPRVALRSRYFYTAVPRGISRAQDRYDYIPGRSLLSRYLGDRVNRRIHVTLAETFSCSFSARPPPLRVQLSLSLSFSPSLLFSLQLTFLSCPAARSRFITT